MMARPSRLDRLLGLLRTGPSEAARLAAGRQLGAIQREHPEQLHALLQRVLCYLFHEEWETRRAAAHALEEIAEAVTTWQPSHPDAASAEVEAAARDEASGAWLSFESFAIDRVLAHGAPLLASGGQEFRPTTRRTTGRTSACSARGRSCRSSSASTPSEAPSAGASSAR